MFLIAKLKTICFKKNSEALRFVGLLGIVLGSRLRGNDNAFAGMVVGYGFESLSHRE